MAFDRSLESRFHFEAYKVSIGLGMKGWPAQWKKKVNNSLWNWAKVDAHSLKLAACSMSWCWGCSSPKAGLCTSPCWIGRGSHSPFLQPVQVTSYLQHPGAPQRGQTAAGKGSSWPRLRCEILICNEQTQQDQKAQNGYLPTESWATAYNMPQMTHTKIQCDTINLSEVADIQIVLECICRQPGLTISSSLSF